MWNGLDRHPDNTSMDNTLRNGLTGLSVYMFAALHDYHPLYQCSLLTLRAHNAKWLEWTLHMYLFPVQM